MRRERRRDGGLCLALFIEALLLLPLQLLLLLLSLLLLSL
jgi:hypothetical protein